MKQSLNGWSFGILALDSYRTILSDPITLVHRGVSCRDLKLQGSPNPLIWPLQPMRQVATDARRLNLISDTMALVLYVRQAKVGSLRQESHIDKLQV